MAYSDQIQEQKMQVRETYRTFQVEMQYLEEMPTHKKQYREALKNFLKKQEDASGKAGLRKDGKFYGQKLPKAGGGTEAFQTIGYGHKIAIGDESSFASGITGQQRESMLDKDINTRGRKAAKDSYNYRFRTKIKQGHGGHGALPEKHKTLLDEYAFQGHKGHDLMLKMYNKASDKEISKEYIKGTGDTKYRTEGRTDFYKELVSLDNRNRVNALKSLLPVYTDFINEHAFKLYKSMGIPDKYSKEWADKAIVEAKKFDKKDISQKDLEKFNRLVAKQLGDLGLEKVR